MKRGERGISCLAVLLIGVFPPACSGVARICCEEEQRLKLCHGALTVDFEAGCSSFSMTNSFVTNAGLIERAVSCWDLYQLISQTTQYLDNWLSNLEVEGARAPMPHSWRRHCLHVKGRNKECKRQKIRKTRIKSAASRTTVFWTHCSVSIVFRCACLFCMFCREDLKSNRRWIWSRFLCFCHCCCCKWLFLWHHGYMQYKWHRTRSRGM